MIFEVHQMMLEDEDYKESIENIISTQQVNAEYAVASTEIIFPRCLQAWMMIIWRARAADIKDISVVCKKICLDSRQM